MSFCLIDDIEQGTAKWLQWRRGVIGAFEASIIMEKNTFGTVKAGNDRGKLQLQKVCWLLTFVPVFCNVWGENFFK